MTPRKPAWKDALNRGLAVCKSSIPALAERIGVKRQTIYHWLKGTRKPKKGHQQSLLGMFPPAEKS